jgi:hypothetical protein
MILCRIQGLDAASNSVGLSAEEWLQRYALEASLMQIYKGEEVFWRQQSCQNWLLKGDATTSYFHAIPKGRCRRCTIPSLWEDDHLLEDARGISTHIYSFFKELFTAGPCSGVSLAEDFWLDRAMVFADENMELTVPFSLEEVRRVNMEMKDDSAPGPDRILVILF